MSGGTGAQGTAGRRPLEGLRVLDLSRVLSGPFATMNLGDLGAEVIKVEDIAGSDTTRHNHPFVGGESHYFLAVNRNKRSIALDLKQPEGLEIVLRLAALCDVVVENFRPGVADRIGIGHTALSARNPSLVYASLSGFGQTGPMREAIAYDLVIQALTGAMAVTGEADRPPAKMGLPLADELSGLFAAIGILAALERRDASGRGCYLDVGMFDVGLALLSYMANIYFATGEGPRRLGSSHPTIYPYNAFATRDGHIVAAPFTQDFWRKFCRVLGRPDLADDARFRGFKERLQNRAELEPLLNGIMRTRSTAEWLALLDKGDVPNGPVNSVAEALEMPQTAARGMVVDIEHPKAGRLRSLGTPFRFDFADAAQFQPSFEPAPVLGQHGAQILADTLGYDAAAIARLAETGVVRLSETAPRTTPVWLGPRALPAVRPGDAGAMPLAGIRVLDLTRMFAGPYCGMLLADLGAEVLKIEEPPIGDPTRRNIPMVQGESTYYMAVNRGKKSVVLDLKQPEDRAAFLDLVRTADVLVENFRPGVMDRLGLAPASLRAANPRLVVCSISGFGQDGPLRDKISFDLVNQAMAGTMAVTGEEGRPPVRIGVPAGDLAGGIYATMAVLAALRSRRETGQGAHVDLALHDVMVALLGYLAQLYFLTGESAKPVGSGHHHIAPYGAYEASDGHLIVAAFTQEFWLKFTRAVERPDLAADPRFRGMVDRKTHKEALEAVIRPLLRGRTVEEWIARLTAADVPCARIASVGEALESAQAASRDMVFDFAHPIAGPQRAVGTPFRADGSVWRSPLPPPSLGQHTEELLAEIAAKRD
jgi:crotonobetainyl-CoA:carnitine CoA-transferase CaiB-like acyl-CoA transferase